MGTALALGGGVLLIALLVRGARAASTPRPPATAPGPQPAAHPAPAPDRCGRIKIEIASLLEKPMPTEPELLRALDLAATNEQACGLAETRKALAAKLLVVRMLAKGLPEEPAGPPLRSRTPEVGKLQDLLKRRFPNIAAFVGPTDAILGPKTWNATDYAIGMGWWRKSAAAVLLAVEKAGPEIGTMLHLAPPDRVQAVQRALGVKPDGYLGDETWATLAKRLPDWPKYPWRDVPDGIEARLRQRATA